MDIFSSNSMLLMEKSMNFLWTKQTAISDNIANAETPNYKAKLVTFEEELRGKLENSLRSNTPRKSAREVLENSEFTVVRTQESTRMDDNGVNTTEQMVELVRNAYQLQYVMTAINSDLSALRTVAKGQ
ncbi:MAG: flagellar basal body rod protein FlgB [Oscillospiraceae bacterium]|nr:flagellar basal body rod protein FlgB [Oscillospiraceae bacterium]